MNWLVIRTKRFFKILNYTDHFFIFASAATKCVLISAFVSLFGISVGIASSAATIKTANAVTAGIKKYKSIIKKKKETW